MLVVHPTPEQEQAASLFATGKPLVIEAGAGTGKTSTLVMLAEENRHRVGTYVAFNRSIAADAARKMPMSVSASTMHSLAMRDVGRRLRHRLDSPRIHGTRLARMMGVGPVVLQVGSRSKVLQPNFLAGHVLKAVARFCQSADDEPGVRHFPRIEGIDLPNADGRRTFNNNNELARHLSGHLTDAWDDLTKPDGEFRFTHDVYLKIWQLQRHEIPGDFVLMDEAQDLNGVMAAALATAAAAGKQIVAVGDSQQQLYEWRGSHSDLMHMPDANRTFLTQSFRFGPAVADVANRILTELGAELRLTGSPDVDSAVGVIEVPRAMLCRTNAAAVNAVLSLQRRGLQAFLAGGGEEVVAFARAAAALQNGEKTYHPELVCFDSWKEVQDYTANDPQGDELRMMVHLLDEYGVQIVMDALSGLVGEDHADVVVSTAHKCSPPDEPILTTKGWKPIGKLDQEHDRIASYARKTNRLTWGGRDRTGGKRGDPGAVKGFGFTRSVRDYDGDLVVIETDLSRTRITPEHRVLIAFAPSFWNRWAVYLMRRGDWWRVGMCRTGNRPYRSGDLGSRISAEGAEAGWLLSLHDTREAAAAEEARIQTVSGVTGLMFERRRGLLSAGAMHAIHEEAAPVMRIRAKALLDVYGLLEDEPLYYNRPGARQQGLFETVAANLPPLSGCILVPCGIPEFHDLTPHRRGGWSPSQLTAVVSREPYSGLVYGLEVEPYHFYLSGNAVVHNSKGREWDTVHLATDFDGNEADNGTMPTPELRLLYVACTRAKLGLDPTWCKAVRRLTNPSHATPEVAL